MPENISFAKLAYMATNNLMELIELLLEHREKESDTRLKKGQVFASDGSIVTL